MAYQVIKNMPMPPSTAAKKYNFEDLEVGDMLFVPNLKTESSTKNQNKVSSAANAYGKSRGMKFATQVVDNDGVIGVGVWRTQ